MMGLRNSAILCMALLLAFSSSIQGLDVINVLSKYPEFAKFSKYLTETKLVDQINAQKAVTVMALDDQALSSLSGKSLDAIKTVLGSQILVDLYDMKQFSMAQGSHTKMATVDGAGVYIDLINEGEFAYSPAADPKRHGSILMQDLVLSGDVYLYQVTAPIVAPPVADAAPSKAAVASTIATAPVAVGEFAPAPAPSSASRLVGGAVMALASLFISL